MESKKRTKKNKDTPKQKVISRVEQNNGDGESEEMQAENSLVRKYIFIDVSD